MMGAVRVADAVEAFLHHLAVERGSAANTLRSYTGDLHRYLEHLGDRDLAEVRTADVTAFVAALRDGQLAASSTARALAAVRGLHRFAARDGIVAEDVARDVTPPAQPLRLPRTLTTDEVEQLLAGCVGDGPVALRDRALLELLYSTGARISEAVGLDVDDLDDEQRVVRLHGKGGKDRIVPVGRPALASVDAYRVRARPDLARRGRGCPALFVNARGARLSRQSAWHVLRGAADAAGLTAEVSPHTLRHCFATHLLAGGADVRVVQELLGHASVTTTQIYTHVTVDTLREVYATSHPRAVSPRSGGTADPRLTSVEFDGRSTAGRVAGRRGVLLLCPHRPCTGRPRQTRSAGMQTPRPLAPRTEPLDEEETAQQAGSVGRHRLKVPEPAPLEEHGPARVIAVANQKGGVGKTTSTINLGAALAEYGRRVLLVDFDPQGALSVGLGVQAHELETTIYNLLMERGVEIDDVIRPTSVEGMDLLPSNIDLSAAEVQLVTEVGREQALGRALKPVLDRYDVILIDCQPSLGLLTINALACAERILIPLACEFFSLRGVALLMDTVDKVQDRLNPDLKIIGILATMFDPRTMHAREVRNRVIEAFGDLVFDAVINRTVRFPETTVAGEPITTWAPTSNGAQAYRLLAREVLAR